MWQDLLQKVPDEDLLTYAFGALALVCGVVLLSVHIIAKNWRKLRQYQIDASLKHNMIDRGMPAADIERIISSKNVEPDEKPIRYPTPSDVVVEWEAEWYPALLLKTDGTKYYVHYKGYDEEEWVTVDRIRFPAQMQAAPTAEPQQVSSLVV